MQTKQTIRLRASDFYWYGRCPRYLWYQVHVRRKPTLRERIGLWRGKLFHAIVARRRIWWKNITVNLYDEKKICDVVKNKKMYETPLPWTSQDLGVDVVLRGIPDYILLDGHEPAGVIEYKSSKFNEHVFEGTIYQAYAYLRVLGMDSGIVMIAFRDVMYIEDAYDVYEFVEGIAKKIIKEVLLSDKAPNPKPQAFCRKCRYKDLCRSS